MIISKAKKPVDPEIRIYFCLVFWAFFSFSRLVISKAFFSLVADKPIFVVGETGGELDLLIRDNPKAGWFCDIENKFQIAKKIDGIATCNLGELKGFPRQTIEKEYNFSTLGIKYVKLFKELLDKKN